LDNIVVLCGPHATNSSDLLLVDLKYGSTTYGTENALS